MNSQLNWQHKYFGPGSWHIFRASRHCAKSLHPYPQCLAEVKLKSALLFGPWNFQLQLYIYLYFDMQTHKHVPQTHTHVHTPTPQDNIYSGCSVEGSSVIYKWVFPLSSMFWYTEGLRCLELLMVTQHVTAGLTSGSVFFSLKNTNTNERGCVCSALQKRTKREEM